MSTAESTLTIEASRALGYIAELIGEMNVETERAESSRKLGDRRVLAEGMALLGAVGEAIAALRSAESDLSAALLRHAAHHPARARTFGGWSASITTAASHKYDAPRLVALIGATLAEDVLVDDDGEPVPPALAVQQACILMAEIAGMDVASAKWREGTGAPGRKRGLGFLGINPNDYRDTTHKETLKVTRAPVVEAVDDAAA